jgi:uncharacterized protein (TIGR02145 family)
MNRITLLLVGLICIVSCRKDVVDKRAYIPGTPNINTSIAIEITPTNVLIGGVISDQGHGDVVDRGVCWSTTPDVSIDNSRTSDGIGMGTFKSKAEGLSPNTTYYICAYATNKVGTGYGNVVTVKTPKIPSIGKVGQGVTDINGNNYKTVIIGNQEWMAENLKVSKFNNGIDIPLVTNKSNWSKLNTGAYTFYDGSSSNDAIYGKIYNWNVITEQNVCPMNWHVPTNAEWKVLTDYLGGDIVAGGKMKEVGYSHWTTPNIEAVNSSLFDGLPGGYSNSSGDYRDLNTAALWWSAEQPQGNLASHVEVDSKSGSVIYSTIAKRSGLSIRCVKDNK